ncbi:MAG: PD-(D/E)XK nuclease family transposase [Selenomonadaceae bacterium]|nr:PD-(D/E)XK nuclease family transposase [Selenomonadaceae bacterium]
MVNDKIQKYMPYIQRLRLIDDTFFHCCFKDSPECMELLLRIVIKRPKLKVKRVTTQEQVPNIYGREVIFDVFAEDADGKNYDVEVQRSPEGAAPLRARYNSSMLDTMSVEKGVKWHDLNEIKVIFLTETDVLGGGLPIYHIRRTIKELNKHSV